MLKKIYLSIFVIFILAFLAGNFSEPQYFNQGVDYINLQLTKMER